MYAPFVSNCLVVTTEPFDTQELENGNDTYGKYAFQKYKFRGARYEAEQGFPSVIEVINNANKICTFYPGAC